MPDRPFSQYGKEWIGWVRERYRLNHPWSHVQISGVALRDGDEWLALWTQFLLTDSSKPAPGDHGPSIVDDADVWAFRLVFPFETFPRLLRDLRAGSLPQERFTGSRGRLNFGTKNKRLEPTGMPTLHPPDHNKVTQPIRRWPEWCLDLRAGNPEEHFGQSFYRQLVKIDQRLQSRTSVSIAELGVKLGVRVQGSHTSTAWNEPCTSNLIAPVAVRLASVIWDTQESRLLVTVDRGSRVTPKAIGVAPFDLHGPRLDPKRPQSKGGRRLNFTWSLPSQPGPQSVVRLSIGDTPLYERLIEGLSETVLGRSLFDDPASVWTGIGRRWFKRSALPSGGQADVWIVEDDKGNRGVLKVPRTDRADPRRLERFRREASTLTRLQGRSPFVVNLLDSSRDSAAAPAHVTELAALGSFETNVQLFEGDAWRSLRLARDIAACLQVAHGEGLVHRDIKPGNLLLVDPCRVAVTDFGVVHDPTLPALTTTNDRINSRWFSPKEFATSAAPTPASDTFMLGRVIYWMLSGGLHYDDNDYRSGKWNLINSLNSSRAEAINELLDKMVDPDAGKRLNGMDLVISAIDETFFRLFGRGGAWCPVCGEAQLKRLGNVRTPGGTEVIVDMADRARGADDFKVNVRACPHCGHVAGSITNPQLLKAIRDA